MLTQHLLRPRYRSKSSAVVELDKVGALVSKDAPRMVSLAMPGLAPNTDLASV